MPEERLSAVPMRNVRLIFKNFEGKPGLYNQKGEKNFGVILPNDETAEAMLADGWAVKYLKPRPDDEDETETPWLQVKVAYDKGRPPRVTLITSRGRTALDEDTVQELDWADITKVDLIVNPYSWDVNGKSGIAAYLKTMFVTIEEDELEREYAEMDSQ